MFQDWPNTNNRTKSDMIKADIRVPCIELSKGKIGVSRNPIGDVLRIVIPSNNGPKVDNSDWTWERGTNRLIT